MSFFTAKISLNGLFKRSRAESEAAQFGRDARIDWQIVVLAFLFLNVLAVGISVFVYGEINKGELFLVDKKETVSLQTLDTFELERTVGFFEEKRARFETLKRTPLSTTDPFIPKPAPKK